MAQLKNTTFSDNSSLRLPAGTTAQRPTIPAAGMIRYNTSLNQTEFYDGNIWRIVADSFPEATGGTIVDIDIGGVPYRIHYFTTTGNSTFTVTKGGEVEYLVVAGGGNGSHTNVTSATIAGGGGGGGGVRVGFLTVSGGQSYTVTVGAGSQNSVFSTITAAAGGAGAGGPGAAGGSGGGAGSWENSFSSNGAPFLGGAGNTPATTPSQGNNGGNGYYQLFSPGGVERAGGGGGAGQAGEAGTIDRAGNGGHGIISSITGSAKFYGGGGGGASRYGASVPGLGGLGGGGLARNFGSIRAGSGAPNTGGGGGGFTAGGAGDQGGGGFGGSGIVVVRYRRNVVTVASPTRLENSTLPANLSIPERDLVFYVDPNNPLSWDGTTLRDIAGGRNMTFGSSTSVVSTFGPRHFSSSAGERGAGSLDTGYRFGLIANGDRVVNSAEPWTVISAIWKDNSSNPNNWWHLFTDGNSGDIFTIQTNGNFDTSMNGTAQNGTWSTGADFTYSGVNWGTMKLGWNFFGVEYDRPNSRLRCFVDNGALIYSSYTTGRVINNNFLLRNFHGWGSANSDYHSDASHGPTLAYQRVLTPEEVKNTINILRIRYNIN